MRRLGGRPGQIKKKYKAAPEYPWGEDDGAVLRHGDNRKWFALVMNIGREKLGLAGEGKVDVINLKIDDMVFRDVLLQDKGIFPAYHMNKEHWITVLLDGTVEEDQMRPPKEWIVPANPKFYDIEHAFDLAEIIEWKQSSAVKAGDTVYLYVAAPVSAILYKCKAVEVDIPYRYQDENLTISTVMRIKLLRRYAPEAFPFGRLKEEYGIYAVRGPRGVPNSLSHALRE